MMREKYCFSHTHTHTHTHERAAGLMKWKCPVITQVMTAEVGRLAYLLYGVTGVCLVLPKSLISTIILVYFLFVL